MSESASFKLIIEDDEGRRSVVPIDLGEVSIGRLAENTIRLDERNVSRRHASLAKDNGSVYAVDLDSYNGVWVNGDRIKGKREIREGDLIRIGDFHLELRGEGLLRRTEETTQRTLIPTRENTQPEIHLPPAPDAQPAAASAPPPGPPPVAPPPATPAPPPVPHKTESASVPFREPPKPVKPAGAPVEEEEENRNEATAIIRLDAAGLMAPKQATTLAGDKPKLICVSTNLAGHEYEITKTEVIIGRTGENDIAIDHRSVSRQHAKILVQGNRVTLVDLKSANGTLVNGEEYAQTELKKGDLLELGHVKFRFVPAGQVYNLPPDEAAAVRGAGAQPAAASMEAPEPTVGEDQPVVKRLPVVYIGGGAVVVLLAVILIVVLSSSDDDKPQAPVIGGQVQQVQATPAAAGSQSPEVTALLNRAQAAMAEKRWDDAASLAKAVLALEAGNQSAAQLVQRSQEEATAQQAYDAAQAAANRNDWAGARQALEQVPPTSSYGSQAQTLGQQIKGALANELVTKARAALAVGSVDAAEAAVNELASIDPANAAASELRGQIDEARAKHASAGASSSPRPPPPRSDRPTPPPTKAAPSTPPPRADRPPPTPPAPPPATPPQTTPAAAPKGNDAGSAYAEGVGLMKAGDIEGAIEALLRCAQLDPNRSLCHRALGIAYAKSGNGQKAAKHYRLYLKIEPNAKDADAVRKILEQYETQ